MKIMTNDWITTDDVVQGDTIRFEENVYTGSYRSAKLLGKRLVTAYVRKESYGELKQQHTFTIEVIECDGIQPIAAGKVTRRKGRNIYKHGVMRLKWEDEASRQSVADEKHERGDINRMRRDQRKQEEVWR